MVKISETDKKTVTAKKKISLENIVVEDLKLVDVDLETGEKMDITKQVLEAIPDYVKTLNFKITIDLIEPEDETGESDAE